MKRWLIKASVRMALTLLVGGRLCYAEAGRAGSLGFDEASTSRALEAAVNGSLGPAAQAQYLERLRFALPPGMWEKWLSLRRGASGAYVQAAGWYGEAASVAALAARYADGRAIREVLGAGGAPALASVGHELQIPVAGGGGDLESGALLSLAQWYVRSDRTETKPAAWLKSLQQGEVGGAR